MKTTKAVLIQAFIDNFILKHRRERVAIQLGDSQKRNGFTALLNHQWDNVLDIRKLTPLPKVPDDYLFVKQQLGIDNNEPCYMLSDHSDWDDRFMPFESAFNECHGRLFGTLIIMQQGTKLYLETEEPGHLNRFTGKIP